MTTFRIGQWVVFDVDEPLEHGIGTVVSLPFEAPSVIGGGTKQKILWHLEGEESSVFTRWLRPYKDPLDSPNYSVGAGKTVRALATAINHTLPYAFEEVTRDLERARMQQEDIRTNYTKKIDDIADKNAHIEVALTSLDLMLPRIDERQADSHYLEYLVFLARRNLIQSLPHHPEYEDSE